MKYLISFILGCMFSIIIIPEEPVKKYCTIKLNDKNNYTSYITGEAVE